LPDVSQLVAGSHFETLFAMVCSQRRNDRTMKSSQRSQSIAEASSERTQPIKSPSSKHQQPSTFCYPDLQTHTMKYPTALFALAWTTSSAFHVVPTMQVARRRVILQDTSVQPPPIDKARAQYCAENVGACSVDEMEEMREREHIFVFDRYTISSHSSGQHLSLNSFFFSSDCINVVYSSSSGASPKLYVWRIWRSES
jgi:hypothetical protein